MAWNRSSGTVLVKDRGSSFPTKGIYWILGCIAVVSVLMFVMWPTKEVVEELEPVRNQRTVKRAESQLQTNDQGRSSHVVVKESVRPKFLSDGTPVPPDGRLTKLGRKKIHGVVTNFSNQAVETVAENGVEQVLLQVFSKQRGDMPLPMPVRFSRKNQEEMAAILMAERKIEKDDSDSVRAQKEILNEAKRELTEYVKSGGTVEEFLNFYQRELEISYRFRKEAIRMAMDAYCNEGENSATDLCDALNKKLEEKGIKPISIPKRNRN